MAEKETGGAVRPLSASEINDLRLLAIHCRRDNAPPLVAVEDIERWLVTLSELRTARESDGRAYQANFELQQRQIEELVLALMWCKPRLKQEAYQSHIEWTLTKYPKPPKVDEPPIVRSKNPDDDFCPSDPRGPGRTGGDGRLTTARLKQLGKAAADSANKNGRTG